MNRITFIGGARGVGKTAIVDQIKGDKGISVLNTGDMLVYSKKNDCDFEKYLLDQLKEFEGILDTHYAGYCGDNFVRGLSRNSLINIKKHKLIDLILIDSDKYALYQRRIKDESNSRIHDLNHIKNELKQNQLYFNEYCKDLEIDGLMVNNINFKESINLIVERLK